MLVNRGSGSQPREGTSLHNRLCNCEFSALARRGFRNTGQICIPCQYDHIVARRKGRARFCRALALFERLISLISRGSRVRSRSPHVVAPLQKSLSPNDRPGPRSGRQRLPTLETRCHWPHRLMENDFDAVSYRPHTCTCRPMSTEPGYDTTEFDLDLDDEDYFSGSTLPHCRRC